MTVSQGTSRSFGKALAWRGLTALALLGVLVAADGFRRDPRPAAPAQAVWPAQPAGSQTSAGAALSKLVLVQQGHLPMPADVPSAHASNLLALPKGHAAALVAFWFLGTRESGPDVQIGASYFDRATQQWSEVQAVVNRHTLGNALGLGVRRIGNPVAWLDGRGRIHLFVVATGLGGWAAGRIVHLVQSEVAAGSKSDAKTAALTFETPRLLPLSWLWNISFLVRGAPLPLADGGMVLPVYFELGVKYPVALRLDAEGQILGATRISSRKDLLQPTLLALSEARWLALMRNQRAGGNIAVAQTDNGGQSWRDMPDLALTNPDASVAGLALRPETFFLAHNSSPQNRQILDLSQSANGLDWSLAQPLAHGGALTEYSYPAMAWADDSLWVSFTDQRRSIAWQRFAWVTAP